MVIPPVQSFRPVVDPQHSLHGIRAAAALPFGTKENKQFVSRLVGYHEHHRGQPNRRWLSLMHLRRRHLGQHAPIRLTARGVVYIIYSRDPKEDRMYTGLTHGTCIKRIKQHKNAARAHMRRPARRRGIHKRAHLLYRKWGESGLRNWAIFPIEKLPDEHISPREFARRYAARENFWIDTAKTLDERGFNVRGDNPTHRVANRLKHQELRQQRQQQQPSMSATPASSPHPAEQHGTNAMPGAFRNSSYARTAHALLRQLPAGTTSVPETLTEDHHLVQYLSPMRLRTLDKMLVVLQTCSLQ